MEIVDASRAIKVYNSSLDMCGYLNIIDHIHICGLQSRITAKLARRESLQLKRLWL